MLQLTGVHTHIGAYHILHGVNLSVKQGEITVLLGRNGVGKSTTLRTIMGLWKTSQGSIELLGKSIGGESGQLATPQIAQMGVAYVPENMGVFADLTVSENMLLAARQAKNVAQIDSRRLEQLFEWFPALKTFWKHPAGLLSGGQKQMLAIARAMIEPRQLLIVDEPSKGLAPAIVNNLAKAFAALREEKTTVLLVEQNFHFASQVGDAVAVMDNGQVVHQGRMQGLRDDKALQQQLLGLSV